MFPVLFIIAIVSWAYFVYVVMLQAPLFVQKPFCTTLELLGFHILFAFFLVSYFRTVITNPGEIPQDFPEEGENVILERTEEGTLRECVKCKKKKPDRSHHCSICGKCTLKMDHHCPWVNNCVGFRNYKFFVLFLTYTVVLCLYVAFTSLPWILANAFVKEIGGYNIQIVMLFFVTSVFSLGILLFSIQHYRLILVNVTTIESFEKSRKISWKNTQTNNKLNEPYNLGWKKNFCQVLGPSPWLWLIPIANSMGDGLSFPIRTEQQRLLEEV